MNHTLKKNDDVPPTEPSRIATAGAAVAGAATTPPPKRTTGIAGSKLVPDLTTNKVALLTRFWFWLGVTPNCPVDQIDIVGVGFPKVTETVTTQGKKTMRFPQIGHLVQLTARQIRSVAERLPRTVVRILGEKTQQEMVDEAGIGLNIVDAHAHTRRRRGQLITIPREADAKALEAAGRAAHRYEQGPNDQPAARYMFLVLCQDQMKPAAGAVYPETLETAGLPWPFEGEPV